MVQLNFDANQVAPNTGFEPVPEGWYNVAITESEVKPTKDNEGAMLVLKASIIDGPHANKPIFIRLNIQNKNQQAVDIAYGELSAICHVTGVYQIGDSSQLHGIPFQVRVVVRPAKDGYDASNDVKGYKDAAGNEPGKAKTQGGGQPSNFGGAPQGQGQPQQNPAQGGNPGWGQQPQGNPNQGQPQGNPQGQGAPAWGGQQGQQPAQNPQGQGNPAWGQGQPQGQPQGDPNAGQGGGAPAWGGGQPAQGQQQPPQGQGNAGWTQNPQGNAPQGGPAWGNTNGQ
jgi:hypothetical protein